MAGQPATLIDWATVDTEHPIQQTPPGRPLNYQHNRDNPEPECRKDRHGHHFGSDEHREHDESEPAHNSSDSVYMSDVTFHFHV